MRIIPVLFAVLALAGCTTGPNRLEPVPGSINYGGPSTPLRKAPVGSIHKHQFLYRGGMAFETYRVNPDRSLTLIDRRIADNWPPE